MLASSASAQTAAVGLNSDVEFTEYSALSTSAELVRRLSSPLTSRVNAFQSMCRRTLKPSDIAIPC
jgi:hypothetical protein